MRSMVTGGAGFIGSHIADALVEIGHEVLIIDDLSRGRRENVPQSCDFAQVSVTSSEVERIIHDFRPAAIFHLAAQAEVRRSVTDPVFDTQVNVQGTVRIAAAAARARAEVILFSSTGGAIYGDQESFPAGEEHPSRPASPYGVSKRAAELYLEYFAREVGVRTVALRYANVYGPRQDPHGEAGVVAIFAAKMLAGEAPVINGDGGQTRDYVFVEDVVRANLLALRHTGASGPFNVGTGRETDVNTLAAMLAKAAGYEGEILHGSPKPGEQRRSVIDPRRAAGHLHWEPKVDLEAGISRTVEWFARARG